MSDSLLAGRDDDDLLCEREVIAVLKVSAITVYRLRVSGQLAYKPGRPVTVRVGDLRAYIKEHHACHDRTKDHASRSTSTASLRSGGRRTGALNDFQQGRQIAARLKEGSLASLWKASGGQRQIG